MSHSNLHDDVIKWKHFPRNWPFVRGIHQWAVNSPHKGQWHGSLIFSLICAWTNGWVDNRNAGDLRRHHANWDVTVMRQIDVSHDMVALMFRWYSSICLIYVCRGPKQNISTSEILKHVFREKQKLHKIWQNRKPQEHSQTHVIWEIYVLSMQHIKALSIKIPVGKTYVW